jgi:hypothetical protein
VRNATLVVPVADLEAARRKAVAAVEAQQGFVESASSESGEDDDSQVITLKLRVPGQGFESVLQTLRTLGKPSVDRTSAADVTATYVDLAARVAAKRKLEERVLALLNGTKTIKEALDIERDLGGIRQEVEQLEAQRVLLENQSEHGTIDLRLEPLNVRVVASLTTVGRSINHARADALNMAGLFITTFVRALGVILPVALLICLPLIIAVRVLRRFRRQSTQAS